MSGISTREHTRAGVLETLLAHGYSTRTELGIATGQSKPTISRVVEELTRLGLIEENGRSEAVGRGRRRAVLTIPRTAGHVIGVSFGIQSTNLIATDLTGAELSATSLPTPSFSSPSTAAAWLSERVLAQSASESGEPRWVGIAVPGTVSRGTEITRAAPQISYLDGGEFAAALGRSLPMQTTIDSDASLALTGMTSLPEHATSQTAVLFNMSTVLDVAVRTDGELVRGRSRSFADFTALPVQLAEGQHSLGAMLSVQGLTNYARARGLPGLDAAAPWESAAAHHSDIQRAFVHSLTAAVRVVAATLDPELVFLSGRLAPLANRVLPQIQQEVRQALQQPPHIFISDQKATVKGAVYAARMNAGSALKARLHTG